MNTFFGAVLSILGCLLLAATVSATPSPTAPLPSAVEPPPPGNGIPWGAASVAGAEGSIALAGFGYVEEEFLVSGTANVYGYGPHGAVEVVEADTPYTTRILVRRPEDPQAFSGVVHVETTHPQYGIDVVWAQISDFVLANGDAYVSILTRRTSAMGPREVSAVEIIKSYDPARYGQIDFAEDGLTWDIIGQVGKLLKSDSPDNPLAGYGIQHLYASGWSGGGALLLLYISDGFHERARMPGGEPIFDGYLVGEPSGYPRIHSQATPIDHDNPRQQIRRRDVPAISLYTRPQEAYRRRADSDDPGDRYRAYEVAGAAHSDYRQSRGVFPVTLQFDDTLAGGAGEQLCAHEITRFPLHHQFKSTLARLHAWVALDVVPPASLAITLDADGQPLRDRHGNPLGGVRTTYSDLPIARYFTNEPAPGDMSRSCPSIGAQERFTTAELVDLYGSRANYVRKVEQRLEELVHDGWILPADADEVRREAATLGR